MNFHFAFILTALTVLLSSCKIDARRSGGSSRRTGSSNSGGSSRGTWSRNPTSRPSQSQSSGGSSPGHIGWNPPPKQPTSVNKPSAPNPEHISKTSATNVQSSGNWQPSGGYGQNTGGAFGQQGRNPSTGQGNPSAPYPPPGSNIHPPNYGTPGGHPPSYGTPGGHPPSYGTPGGHPPSYGTPGGHPPSYGTPGGHPPSYGTPGGQPPSYGTAMGHPPSYGAPGGYHQPQYNGHNPPPYQPNSYNPSYGHSYTPGAGYNPPVGGYSQPQTILVQSGQSSRPGIGQLAKEAFVFAGVSAGVNAVVNRVLPGGIHNIPSHSYGNTPVAASGAVPGTTHTEITYNNYYNNGTAPAPGINQPAPGINQPAQDINQPTQIATNPIVPNQSVTNTNTNTPGQSSTAIGNIDNNSSALKPPIEEELKFTSPMGRDTFKHEIEQMSEELLRNDINNNAFKYITMNLQGQKIDGSTTDDSPDNLLTVNNIAWELPTIKTLLNLHDNYELNSKVKEIVSEHERDEENNLINAIVDTDVMKITMNFLITKGYIADEIYEFKNALKRIWFTQFKRSENDAGSSGFETVFLAEKIDTEIIGLHNWIYYAKKEMDKSLNYLGYIKNTTLGDRGAVVKVRSRLNDTPQDVTTLFVGTSPELEMSLYTMCFYISPNYPCPIKLAGYDFIISTSRVIYYDKDILVSAFIELWIPPPPPPAQSAISDNLNTQQQQQQQQQQQNSEMINRRLTTGSNSSSSSESQFYSTLFLWKIHCLMLLLLIKLF